MKFHDGARPHSRIAALYYSCTARASDNLIKKLSKFFCLTLGVERANPAERFLSVYKQFTIFRLSYFALRHIAF